MFTWLWHVAVSFHACMVVVCGMAMDSSAVGLEGLSLMISSLFHVSVAVWCGGGWSLVVDVTWWHWVQATSITERRVL